MLWCGGTFVCLFVCLFVMGVILETFGVLPLTVLQRKFLRKCIQFRELSAALMQIKCMCSFV